MVFSACEAEIASWIYPELGAYPFVRGHVIMVVQWIESWVSRQSAHALDSTHLVQNSSYSKIHVELEKDPQLRC